MLDVDRGHQNAASSEAKLEWSTWSRLDHLGRSKMFGIGLESWMGTEQQ